MKEQEQQKLIVDEVTKLEPIVEENGKSMDNSSSGQALLVSENETAQPVVPKRHVTIVDYYTSGSGDLSTTVGMCDSFFANCSLAVLLATLLVS